VRNIKDGLELGSAIVDSVTALQQTKSVEKITAWNVVWQRQCKNVPQLIVPLRLLDAGTNYLITKRPEALLNLPLEERKILKKVLKISDESQSTDDSISALP
jgi:hypothetical protein